MERGFDIDRIKKREIKLEELKIPKIIVNTIKKSVIPEKYLCHILRYKRYCAKDIKNIMLNRRLKS